MATGDGHGPKKDPLACVWSPDAASRENCRPRGVAQTFQACEKSVDPRPAKRARNLFAKDELRSALTDEIEERGGEVSSIIRSLL